MNNIIVEAKEAVEREGLLAVRQISAGLTFRDFRALQENTPNVEAMSPRKSFAPGQRVAAFRSGTAGADRRAPELHRHL